ncbi:hypothetical protein BKA70DRAFT_1577662, partial [Coprinopsis sp. MPI-PUGE-AT-0042]
MFRAAWKRALCARSVTSTGLESSFHSSAPAMGKKYNPKEWTIVGTSPGDCEL